jgi:hypothetical protein
VRKVIHLECSASMGSNSTHAFGAFPQCVEQPRGQRQAAIDLVSGVVMGGHNRTGNGMYLVRVADPGNGSALTRASERLEALPSVSAASPVSPSDPSDWSMSQDRSGSLAATGAVSSANRAPSDRPTPLTYDPRSNKHDRAPGLVAGPSDAAKERAPPLRLCARWSTTWSRSASQQTRS